MPDSPPRNRRLQGAVDAERRRLERDLERVQGEIEALTARLDSARHRRDGLDGRLELLDRLEPAQSRRRVEPRRPSPVRDGLRGSRLREVAVRTAVEAGEGASTIHYRDWLELLSAAGYAVASSDPPAALLTQLTRSPVIRRGDAAGTYRIDWDAPVALRRRLTEFERELTQIAAQRIADASDVDEIRARRVRLNREITRTERQLSEALALLGSSRAEPLRLAQN